MPILDDLRLFIRITERISPKCSRSALWRRARDKMLRKARKADILMHWNHDDPDPLIDEFADQDEEPYKAGDLRKELV